MKAIRHFHFGAETPSKKERQWTLPPVTAVVENCPKNEDLRAFLAQQVTNGRPIHFPMTVGLARLHPLDQYSKRKGVEVATAKAKSEYFTLSFDCRPGENSSIETYVRFDCINKESHVASITLRIDYNGTYPEIVDAAVRPTTQKWS